jgi:hypothetical protein
MAQQVCTISSADTSTIRHTSSGTKLGSGSEFDAAVPDAVREARDGLRWTLLGWNAAEAMLAVLEGAP